MRLLGLYIYRLISIQILCIMIQAIIHCDAELILKVKSISHIFCTGVKCMFPLRVSIIRSLRISRRFLYGAWSPRPCYKIESEPALYPDGLLSLNSAWGHSTQSKIIWTNVAHYLIQFYTKKVGLFILNLRLAIRETCLYSKYQKSLG